MVKGVAEIQLMEMRVIQTKNQNQTKKKVGNKIDILLIIIPFYSWLFVTGFILKGHTINIKI